MSVKEKKAEPGEWIPREVHAVRNALTPSRGQPIPVTVGNVAAVVACATAIALDIKEEADGKPMPKLESLFAKTEPQPGFMLRVECLDLAARRIVAALPDLLSAAGMLGTHGGKVPDARLTPSAVVAAPGQDAPEIGEIPGVHSGSVRSSHPMSASGNAAKNSQMRFLCMAFLPENGRPVSLADILSGEGDLKTAILASLNQRARDVLTEVGSACAARLGGAGTPQVVDPQRTQVLFPLEDGNYVSVSPLYSYSMGADIHSRVQTRLWNDDVDQRQRLETRVAHVGGTKPWNTGLLATYLSGRFTRLLSMPPSQFEFDGSALLRQFSKGSLPIVGGSFSDEAVAGFFRARAAHDIRPNADTRDRMIEAIGILCDAALSNLVVVAREASVATALHGKQFEVGDEVTRGASRDIALFIGLLDEEPTEDDFIRVANSTADRVGQRLHGRRPEGGRHQPMFVVDANFHDLVAGVAMQKLQEFE